MTDTPQTLLTPGEVAAKLGISRPMVIHYMDLGRIRCVEVAGRRLIRLSDAVKPQAKRPGQKPAG
jgi:predicted site-specific integrase-resolvase